MAAAPSSFSYTFALIDLLPYGRQGEVAGLARELAAVGHLQRVGQLAGRRGGLRPGCVKSPAMSRDLALS